MGALLATPASYGGVAVPGDFFFLRFGCYESGNPKALDGNQESPQHPRGVTPCRGDPRSTADERPLFATDTRRISSNS